MPDPAIIQPLSTIISAIIAGVFAVIVVRIRPSSSPSTAKPEILIPHPYKYHRPSKIKRLLSGIPIAISRIPRIVLPIAAIILVMLGSFAGYSIGGRLRDKPFNLPVPPSNDAKVTTTPAPTATPGLPPTPIPRGRPLMEIGFANNGDGNCNNYDSRILGYENRQYYIQALSNGYIAVCHNGIWPSQGSLQVTAYPAKESSVFGYGVLFGWAGAGLSTTDACVFGVNRREIGWEGGTPPRMVTEVDFSEFVAGTYMADSKPSPVALDNNPHTLRMTLRPDGSMVGYLDERFIGEYKYSKCGKGPIGLVAWGDGQTKVYFDDLKLFALP